MITKEDAMCARHGDILYHTFDVDSKGRPVKCRVSGMCKTWKRRPLEFKLPVKHGLYSNFYITPINAHEWRKEEYEVIKSRNWKEQLEK